MAYTPPAQSSELFEYTSGRWIYNESLRRSERYVPFNVQELKHVAAKSVGKRAEDVNDFRKLAECGFNRTFEITMNDDLRILARIPYKTTLPRHLTVASEVATIDFVRANGIPAPKILEYSTTSENSVGAEYIIMEVMPGRHLGDIWFQMSESERLKVIVGVVEMEAKLFSIGLPASGSMFYSDDLGLGTRTVDISKKGRNGRQFCIGPATTLSMWSRERSLLDVDRGPHVNSEHLLEAVGVKEMSFLERFGHDRHPYQRIWREFYDYKKQSPAEHRRNLSGYLGIIPYLTPTQGAKLIQPTLRHPDLQPHNIFVSESFDILGIIDWQHCCALPLFLQCGIPKYFQNYGDDESESLREPQLPSNYEDLDDAEKSKSLDLYLKRHLHFHYMGATYTYNRIHWDALSSNQVYLRQRLFHHAHEPWEGDNVSLKADLIQATRKWRALLSTTDNPPRPCPLSYSDNEIEECLRLHSLQLEADDEMNTSCEALGISSEEGWVPNHHYEVAKKLIADAKEEALSAAESDEARVRIKEHWPFDDFDEDN